MTYPVPEEMRAPVADLAQAKLIELVSADIARSELSQMKYAELSASMPSIPASTSDWLNTADDGDDWAVDGLLSTGASMAIIAQRKAGKTHVAHNLARALTDGTPFLGEFTVPERRRVALLDFELPERMLRSWIRAQGFRETESLLPLSMLGRASAFDILTPEGRSRWAELLDARGVQTIIVDCAKPWLQAFGLDERKQLSEIGYVLDALKAECRHLSEVVVVHHAGHATDGNLRARGDSAFEGWARTLVFLEVDDPNDATSPRYLSAIGSDVSVPGALVVMDTETGRLTYSGNSKQAVRAEKADDAVVQFLVSCGGSATRSDIISAGIHRVDKNTLQAITSRLVSLGRVTESVGAYNAKTYSVASGVATSLGGIVGRYMADKDVLS